MQSHHSTSDTNASREDVDKVIKKFANLGLQVHITELDVKTANDSEEELQKQAKIYQNYLEACMLDNPGVCTAFLSWGVTDKYSCFGEAKHPLPFDGNYNKKHAYWRMLDLLNGLPDIAREETTFLQ